MVCVICITTWMIISLWVLRTHRSVPGTLLSQTVCFSRLGLPLHPSKCVGPVTVLVFLGIELDSVAQLARLPSEKFASTLKILHDWERRRWCRRQELESLIGTLHHVCKIIPPGRAFLRRMINLLCCFRNPTHPIRLSAEFDRDLSWWLEFFTSWAGVSFFRMPTLMPLPDFFVSSDAAASLGCRAIWGSYWFSFAWLEFFCRSQHHSVGTLPSRGRRACLGAPVVAPTDRIPLR
jgi:hypothetical protein